MPSIVNKIREEDLRYALEVRRAYYFLGRAMSIEDAETESCLSLHDWAANPKHTGEFLKTMVPKAEEFLQKYSAPEDDQELVAQERKTITELQEFLAVAVAESQFV